MAMYSPELMLRAGNQFAYDRSRNESYLTTCLFSGENYGLSSRKPLVAREDTAGSGYLPISTLSYTNTENRAVASTTRRFDAFGDTSSLPVDTDILQRDGARLTIDLVGWISARTINNLLTSDTYQHSVWELIVYNVRDTRGAYIHATHPILRVDIAARNVSDPDVPESWVGSANPDIRFVVEPNDSPYLIECTEITYDATQVFCESKRYAAAGDNYRDLFAQKTYSVV